MENHDEFVSKYQYKTKEKLLVRKSESPIKVKRNDMKTNNLTKSDSKENNYKSKHQYDLKDNIKKHISEELIPASLLARNKSN